jgi:hypothetical protein
LKPFTLRLVRAIRRPPDTIWNDAGVTIPNPAVVGLPPPEAPYDVACEIFDELDGKKKNPGFDDAGELCDFAFDLWEATADEAEWEDEDEHASRLAALLVQPLDPYQFDVDIGAAGPSRHAFEYHSDLLLLGAYGLRVEPLRHDGAFRGVRLHGLVPAGSFNGAIRRSERAVDEFCGALKCLRLATFALWGRASEPPRVRIRGGKAYGEGYAADPATAQRLCATGLTIPPDLTDIERHAAKKGDLGVALDRHHRSLERLFGSESPRAFELRAACRRAVQAEFSGDFGVALTLAFSCLEGLLLDPKSKSEVLGRLTEAVAHGMGRSVEERAALRVKVKELYELRSVFVHTGSARATSRARTEVLDLAYGVIRREIELLQDPSLERATERP